MREVVDTFPPRLKNIYILSRERHLSVKEIAEKLAGKMKAGWQYAATISFSSFVLPPNKNFIFWFSIFS